MHVRMNVIRVFLQKQIYYIIENNFFNNNKKEGRNWYREQFVDGYALADSTINRVVQQFRKLYTILREVQLTKELLLHLR